MNLWFIVPAHGRARLTGICLAQLARACDQLEATAVVVACDDSLAVADRHGFDTLRRPNNGLGRRFNDGIQHAAHHGATHVVPIGTDDWADPALFNDLPDDRTVACFRACTLVDEAGTLGARLTIPYTGGIGIKIMPVALLELVGCRPADDARDRAVDASILDGLTRASNLLAGPGRNPDDGARLEYRESGPLQIVDFKTRGANLNTFASCVDYADEVGPTPWGDLAAIYGPGPVAEMQAHYGVVPAAA